MDIKRISPLALLALAACKSGGTTSTTTTVTPTVTTPTAPASSSGLAVNGPLYKALAFVDANGNKQFDAGETSVLTGRDGSYNLSNPGGHQIVIQAIEGTQNMATGAFISGITLVGNAGDKLITPLTTLAHENKDLDLSALAKAMGLEGVDLLTYNPYDQSPTDPTAIAAAQAAANITAMLQVMSGALVGSGAAADLTAGYTAAFNALASVIAEKLDANQPLDNYVGEVLTKAGVSDATLATSVTTQIDAISDEIAKVTTLDASDTTLKDAFTAGGALGNAYVKDAASADDLTFTQLAANAAPTNIVLGSGDAPPKIDETVKGPLSENLLVGALTVTDDGAGPFTYALSGSDAAKFVIADGSLYLKSGTPLDAEQADTLNIAITVTDALGKSFYKEFTLSVNNIDEATTGSVTISGNGTVGTALFISETLQDPDNAKDGRGADDFAQMDYQWFANDVVISGANSASLNVTEDLAGKTISAKVITLDQGGGAAVETAATFGTIPPALADITLLLHEGFSQARIDTISADIDTAIGKLNTGFASNEGNDLTPLRNAFETQDVTYEVSDTGVIASAGGYRITANFSNFNPTTLTELESAFASFDGQNISSLQVSGGFNQLSFTGPNGTLMRLEFEEDDSGSADRLRLVNVKAQGQEVKTIGLSGEFDNQFGSLLQVIDTFARPELVTDDGLNSLAQTQALNGFFIQLADVNRPYFEMQWGDNTNRGDLSAYPDFVSLRVDGYYLNIFGDFPERPSDLMDLTNNSIVPIDGLFDFNDTTAALQAFITGAESAGFTNLGRIQFGREIEVDGNRSHEDYADIIINDFSDLILNYQDIDADGETTGSFAPRGAFNFNSDSANFILDNDGMYLILGDGVDLDALLFGEPTATIG